MNVASKELCQELYELSGWNNNDYYWFKFGKHLAGDEELWDVGAIGDIPAYSLGYLLRKLPRSVEYPKKGDTCEIYVGGWVNDPDKWWAGYRFWEPQLVALGYKADTPEDAACKLAIKLFKQGILVREGDKE